MLRCRIQEAAEHLLHNEQYGFRPKRSTSHPLFIIRRLAEIAEEGQTPVVFAFLDWGKAFDRLSHQALFRILERMRFPRQTIDQIKAIYKGPLFSRSSTPTATPTPTISTRASAKAAPSPHTSSTSSCTPSSTTPTDLLDEAVSADYPKSLTPASYYMLMTRLS